MCYFDKQKTWNIKHCDDIHHIEFMLTMINILLNILKLNIITYGKSLTNLLFSNNYRKYNNLIQFLEPKKKNMLIHIDYILVNTI